MEYKEKDLKQTLIDVGITNFNRCGFKPVKVSEIAKQAKIATGSFYKYFESKEELFWICYTVENERMKSTIIENMTFNDTPERVIEQIIALVFENTKDSKLLQEGIQSDFVQKKLNKTAKDFIQSSVFYKLFENLLLQWRSNGVIRDDISNDEILRMFIALCILDVNQNALDDPNYQQTITHLFVALLNYIEK